jgi:hypothetical protein
MLPFGEPTESLRHSMLEGCAHAVMMGAGEAYLPPFAVFLGADAPLIGLLASLPLFAGSIAQLGCVQLLDRVPARRRLVLYPALLQGLAWFPMLVLPICVRNASLLVAIAALYWMAGSFAGPAWNSWMGA